MDHDLQTFVGRPGPAEVTVGVSLHNYGQFVLDALNSVRTQTLGTLSLIVVDDASTDAGAERARRWLVRNRRRFVRTTLVRRRRNAGLAAARNLALELTETPFFFTLDADNAIYPRCLQRLVSALRADRRAAMAYCVIERFGQECGLMGTSAWSGERLAGGNYIDAMALLRTTRLRQVGGYAAMTVPGWEDYDLWCQFVERGWHGVRVPEILARYRVHGASMLHTVTCRRERAGALIAEMRNRHPWLTIPQEQQ